MIRSDSVRLGAPAADSPNLELTRSLYFPSQSPDDRRCAECDKDKSKVSGWRVSKLNPGDWLCQPCSNREVTHAHLPPPTHEMIRSDSVRLGAGG